MKKATEGAREQKSKQLHNTAGSGERKNERKRNETGANRKEKERKQERAMESRERKNNRRQWKRLLMCEILEISIARHSLVDVAVDVAEQTRRGWPSVF